MRKEIWFGLSILVAIVIALFVLMPAPADMPCSARSAQRCSIRVANRQPNSDKPNSARLTSITRRRPSASEMAPCHKAMTAKGSR